MGFHFLWDSSWLVLAVTVRATLARTMVRTTFVRSFGALFADHGSLHIHVASRMVPDIFRTEHAVTKIRGQLPVTVGHRYFVHANRQMTANRWFVVVHPVMTHRAHQVFHVSDDQSLLA